MALLVEHGPGVVRKGQEPQQGHRLLPGESDPDLLRRLQTRASDPCPSNVRPPSLQKTSDADHNQIDMASRPQSTGFATNNHGEGQV